jgi:hypothetical protein
MKKLIERLTGIPFDNGYRWLYPYIFISFIVMVLSLGALTNVLARQPHIAYTEVIPPARSDFCPGDIIEWSLQVTVKGGPEQLLITRTLWSVSESRTVVFDISPEYSIILGDEVVAFPRLSMVVPPLPVGEYQVRVAATGHLTVATAYAIPFRITEACGS